MENADTSKHTQEIETLNKLIREIKFGMMTTVQPDERLFSRPMGAQQLDPCGDLWFFTHRNTGKCEAIANDEQVNISFSSPEKSSYLSIAGSAEIVEDKAKAKELWHPILQAWFPEGLNDPELALIRVRIESAEYWDVTSSSFVQLLGFAKAVVTGRTYKASKGEHGRVDLRH